MAELSINLIREHTLYELDQITQAMPLKFYLGSKY